MDCLYYVQQRQADLVPVDPEDMYVAAKIPNQDFVVFQEYRTDEEPDGMSSLSSLVVQIVYTHNDTTLLSFHPHTTPIDPVLFAYRSSIYFLKQ